MTNPECPTLFIEREVLQRCMNWLLDDLRRSKEYVFDNLQVSVEAPNYFTRPNDVVVVVITPNDEEWPESGPTEKITTQVQLIRNFLSSQILHIDYGCSYPWRNIKLGRLKRSDQFKCWCIEVWSECLPDKKKDLGVGAGGDVPSPGIEPGSSA